MASESPPDLDYFLLNLSTSDVKIKVIFGSRLIAYLEDSSNSIECSDIGMFIDDIIQWLSSNVPKVSQHGIEILTLLVTRMRRGFRPFISNLLPLVVNRLGDNNKELKTRAHNLLMKLMECDSISPRTLFDKIITLNAFKHKNSNVKEGSMMLLLSTIGEFGAHTITISKIVPMIVKILSEPNIPLKHKAIETLVDLYKYIGEQLRVDIQKKYIIPQNISRELMLKFDRARPNIPNIHQIDNPLPYGRSHTIDRKPNLLNPILIDENNFIESFEDVISIHISNGRELNDTMKKLHVSIQNCNEIWSKRVESLKLIRSLVLAGATNYEEFFNNLKYIQHSFQTSIKDLRSQVVRETCITIAFLSQTLGIRFKLFAESIFIYLIELIPNSAKIISSCGLIAAKFILKYTHTPRIIPILVFNLGSKSKNIRRACCEFIHQIMCTWQTQILDRHLIILQNAIKKGIADADKNARDWSRKTYREFCKHFPEEGQLLLKNLDPSYRRILLTNTGFSSSTQNIAMIENSKLPSRNEFTRQRSRSVIDLQSFYNTRSRVQINRPNVNLDHSERIERSKKRDSLSQPSSRSESPSSIGSESSFSSFNQPLNANNWQGSQQKLPQEILENVLGIDDIISKCESLNWNDRREGLENLLIYLNQGYIINEELLKRITNIFSEMLMDSQTRDIILLLDVLNDLIDTHSLYLEYWLFTLLSKLFIKGGSGIFSSVQSRVIKTMDKVRVAFPYDVQLSAVFKFITDPTLIPNTSMKIFALNYITKLTNTIDRGSMISVTESDERKNDADLALKKMTEWTMDDKLNQTPEICKAAEEALAALNNLNSSDFTSRFCDLPDTSQESEFTSHRMRRISSDQLITQKSPKPIGRKLSECTLQPVRTGRSRSQISSQPSSRSESPSSRSAYTEQNSRKGFSGIPRSRCSREVSPNRYNSRGSQSSSKRPPLFPTSKPIISQKMLTQSREAEFALADAFRNTSSRRKVYNYSSEDLSSDTQYESSITSHNESLNSDYLSTLKQTTDKICYITKSLDCDYMDDRVPPSHEIDKTIKNEMIKVLDNLEKKTLSLDYKQLNLNRLDELLKNISFDDLSYNFNQIIKIVLKLLTDNEPAIREQAILLIIYLVQHPDLEMPFLSFTELIILSVLEMSNDPVQSVVKASEECAYILSTALQPEAVIDVITPLITSKKFPINLLAIRMITKLVDKNGNYPVEAHMKEIMPRLLQAYDDRDSTVRKSAVFCMVSLHKVFDKEEFANYVSSLNGPKLKLLDLYIERTQQSSTFSCTD